MKRWKDMTGGERSDRLVIIAASFILAASLLAIAYAAAVMFAYGFASLL